MISYCVMVHNRWPVLQKLLASCRAMIDRDYEIVIVDLGSTDVRLAQQFAGQSQIRIIPGPSPKGRKINRSVGRNIAAQAAAAAADDILFFLDADMLVPATFGQIIRANVGPGECFFPICYSLHQHKPAIVRGNVDQWQKHPERLSNGWWRKEGWGNCGFLRRDYAKLGEWDETIGRKYGGEDNNVCSRAKQLFKMNRFNCHGFFHQWHPPNR